MSQRIQFKVALTASESDCVRDSGPASSAFYRLPQRRDMAQLHPSVEDNDIQSLVEKPVFSTKYLLTYCGAERVRKLNERQWGVKKRWSGIGRSRERSGEPGLLKKM